MIDNEYVFEIMDELINEMGDEKVLADLSDILPADELIRAVNKLVRKYDFRSRYLEF